jgi:hypothetical protein
MPGFVRTMQVDHSKTIRNSFRSFQEGNHSLHGCLPMQILYIFGVDAY